MLSARFVLKEGLLLYSNLNKLDRWGGGGLGLSGLVKLAGWAGLIAVVAALVVKLHAVERKLDPVEHGVDKLRDELDQARASLKAQAELSAQEMQQVHQQTQALQEVLQATIDAHQRDSGAVAEADHGARALSDQLKAALERQRALAARQEAAEGALGTYADQVALTKASLKAASDRNSTDAAGLGDAMKTVHTHLDGLDHAVTALPLQPVSDELVRVGAEAHSLASALQAATRDAQELDLVLRARLDEERQRKQRDDAVAQTVPAVAPEKAHAPAVLSPTSLR